MPDKKVLIVDDDKEFLEELKETLALSGYEMFAVNDSGLALNMATQVRPDVILIDLKMPKKTGFQLADELRHLSGLDHIPIIAMTGFFKDSYGPLLNICGIKKCLKKPFNPLDIIMEIENALAENNKIMPSCNKSIPKNDLSC
ncbi:MAG: response regulator [Candidatus Omnitrophica bacterium]|nr:response regulator [Candidatus Omnitrophota bacterium]